MTALVVFRFHRRRTARGQAILYNGEQTTRLNEGLEDEVEPGTTRLETAHDRSQELESGSALLRRSAAVGELAAIFAHEVRTPLNAISIARQRLARAARLGQPIPLEIARDVVESQERSIEMINGYVESYLKYARDAHNELRAAVSHCRISALVLEVFGHVDPEARNAEVGLLNGVTPENLTVKLNEGTLRCILMNLVLNAVQVQPDGGEVEVGASLENHCLAIEVADRGPGVGEDHAGEIFEPFRSHRAGGTGLGLAICQRLAKEQDATITFRRRPGGGSVFAVGWPV